MDTKFLTLCTLACALSTALADLTEGLVSYWTFDTADLADPVVKDLQGGNDGSFVATPEPGSGIIGEALVFDGIEDAIEVLDPTDGSLDFGAETDFTISAWIKTATTNETTIVSKNDGGTNSRLLFKIDNTGRLFVTISQPNVGKVELRSVTLVNDDEWRHVVLVADRDTGTTVYIDGKSDAETDASDGVDISSDSNFRIGSSIRVGGASRRFFNGSIDDVAIWSSPLTADDIAELYANGLAGKGITGGTPIPFAITEIEYDPDADTVTLTWRKTRAASYIAKYSLDMTGWGSDMGDGLTDANDENPDDADHITVTFDLADFLIENEEDLFFRIEEE